MRAEQLQRMTPDLMAMLRLNPDVVVSVYPDEKSWLAARANLFTASDASILCNRNSFNGLLRLWYQKAGLVSDFASKYEQERTAGHYAEMGIAAWYADVTGLYVVDPGSYCIITNEKYPGIGATLDRLQWSEDHHGPGVLELKNPSEFQRSEWQDGNIPEHANIQTQVQMLVCGLSWGSVACFIGGNKPLWTPVKANPRFQAAIVRAIARFRESLAKGVPPEPTGHETDKQTLDEVYPEDQDIVIDVGASLREVYDELCEISEAKRPLEKREAQLKSIVHAAMGPASRAIGTGYEFTLSRTVSDPKYVIAPHSLAEAVLVHQGLTRAGIEYEVKGGTASSRLTKKKGK